MEGLHFSLQLNNKVQDNMEFVTNSTPYWRIVKKIDAYNFNTIWNWIGPPLVVTIGNLEEFI